MDHTLQQVMAAAVHMEPRFKPRPATTPASQNRATTPNTFANRPFVQDPNRIKCQKCNRWHNINAKCTQLPTGGSGAGRGNDGDRSGNRWKPARVNEVEADDPTNVAEAGHVCEDSDPGSEREAS